MASSLGEVDLDKYCTPEKIQSTRAVLFSNFIKYFAFMFYAVNGTHVFLKPFHYQIADALMKFAFGLNTKRNLMIVVPVGAGKSLIVQYFISWCFALYRDVAFIYTSHSDDLITKLSKETKEICENPYWIKIFKWELKKDAKSKVNWSFEDAKNRTGLTAKAIGSGITGLDAGNPNVTNKINIGDVVEGLVRKVFSGALIIDDPVDVSKVRHPAARKDCIYNYDDKLTTRRRTPDTPTILIQQRLHKEDLAGWALNTEPEDWETVIIKAIDDEGESFWPERYPVDELLKIKKNNPEKYAAQ